MGNACAGNDKEGAVEVAPLEESQPAAPVEEKAEAVAPASEEKKEEAKEVKEEKTTGLTIIFLENGKEVPITFPKQPLGLTFNSDTLPVAITNLPAGGQGETLGVKVGMQIKTIGSADVTTMKYEEVLKTIKDGAASLPSA